MHVYVCVGGGGGSWGGGLGCVYVVVVVVMHLGKVSLNAYKPPEHSFSFTVAGNDAFVL